MIKENVVAAMASTPARQTIKVYGSHGASAHAFSHVVNGVQVAKVEWREFGNRKTKTFTGPKRAREEEARAFAEKVADHLKYGGRTTVTRCTVGALWDAYVTANAVDWRPATLALNAARWKNFTLLVDPQRYADTVTPEILDAWRVQLLTTKRKHGAPMARNQVAHHLELVKSVWLHSKRRKLLADNLLSDYTVRKGKDYKALKIAEYAVDEWGRILLQLDPTSSRTWRPWAAICLDGLLAPRSRALLNLQWTDINFAASTVTWRGDIDKIGNERVQPLPADAIAVLRVCQAWAERQGYTGLYVFYGVQQRTRGTHWTYSALNTALHKAADAAGVSRKPYRAMHGLRRMAGKSVLELTGDITKVGAWLGDTDLKVLRDSYLRDREGDLATVQAGTSLPNTLTMTLPTAVVQKAK